MPFTYECAGCGKPVTRIRRARGARVFCSNDCYHRATIVYPDRECPQCGITFSPRLGPRSGPRKGNPGRTYCSVACFRASQATATKTCPVCGKDFTVGAATAHRYRVCSNACKTADTIYLDCERCGKRFKGEQGGRTRRHCSEECRRPPMILTCRNCGKDFREQPSATHRQFCSIACYRSFTGETLLEGRVRCALEVLGVAFEQEYPVGRWSIDFALTAHKIAIEADGEYWHARTAERDARRDRQLTRTGWRIVRLDEAEVNRASSVSALILDRIREITGLELADLAKAEAVASPIGTEPRKPFRLHSAPIALGGQLALWGDDETAA